MIQRFPLVDHTGLFDTMLVNLVVFSVAIIVYVRRNDHASCWHTDSRYYSPIVCLVMAHMYLFMTVSVAIIH